MATLKGTLVCTLWSKDSFKFTANILSSNRSFTTAFAFTFVCSKKSCVFAQILLNTMILFHRLKTVLEHGFFPFLHAECQIDFRSSENVAETWSSVPSFHEFLFYCEAKLA